MLQQFQLQVRHVSVASKNFQKYIAELLERHVKTFISKGQNFSKVPMISGTMESRNLQRFEIQILKSFSHIKLSVKPFKYESVQKQQLEDMAKLIVRCDKLSVRYIRNKFTTCQK